LSALHHVIAGEHQLDALGVAALDDRTIVADAFEESSRVRLSPMMA
jgi:hypothetical protein